jgi:hypothetical protein
MLLRTADGMMKDNIDDRVLEKKPHDSSATDKPLP